ncbi:unnamed protein product [Caenorhabditis angaria]|uniref:Transthyretin-like family protein n=1 Tax=Caenorhabditis angaria TaxID=860376 RepID=A0A9P1I9L9_9PELO|nr:unnamed protein product [Caenorhabditis angaria]
MLHLLIFLNSVNAIYYMWNITIVGRLFCNGIPMANHQVILIDHDHIPFDKTDFLNETFTDENGNFEVYGQEREFRKIDPRLCIKHLCYEENVVTLHESNTFHKDYLGTVVNFTYNFNRHKKFKDSFLHELRCHQHMSTICN